MLWRLHSTPSDVMVIGNEGPRKERENCDRLLQGSGLIAQVGQVATALSCGWGTETHWWSADGRSWERLPPVRPRLGEPALTGPGPNEYRLITDAPQGLLNLGENRSGEINLWSSSDGRAWNLVDDVEILRDAWLGPLNRARDARIAVPARPTFPLREAVSRRRKPMIAASLPGHPDRRRFWIAVDRTAGEDMCRASPQPSKRLDAA